MTLQIIGAGFGRTGTLSLKTALEILGYNKCHHMMEVATNADQVDYWLRIAENREVPSWDEVFEGYRATTDFPACNYYAALAESYPHAKVILTVRDEDSWYRSVMDTIWQVWQVIPGWLTAAIPRLRKLQKAVGLIVWQGTFAGRANDAEYTKSVFRAHNQQVQETIPADRLLVFEVKEGWQPLCTFLDVPVPDQLFPHVNDTAEMKRRIAVIRCVRYLPLLLAIGVLITVVS
jgi:hypothetical protein